MTRRWKMGLQDQSQVLIVNGRAPKFRETYRLSLERAGGVLHVGLKNDPYQDVLYTWMKMPIPSEPRDLLEFLVGVLCDLNGAAGNFTLMVNGVDAQEGALPLFDACEIINGAFAQKNMTERVSVRKANEIKAEVELFRVDTLIVHCVHNVNLL
jgi:hypothetical protein